MIGKTLGHYRIIEKLGAGGMGVVYKAEDLKLHRHVALKFISPKASAIESEKERLLREARAAAQLDHPNICTVFDVDEIEGQAFVVMSCVPGQSLKEKLEKGALSTEEAMGIALQIAEALREAHEAGVVHRDIKPGNVMVTPTGQIKVMDFGLAEFYEPSPDAPPETTSGTVAYMSPEQLRGEETDFRTDIWSLGIVLYEMLSGRRPFEGEYEQAVVYSVLNVDPEPVGPSGDVVPENIRKIVAKSLEKNRQLRYRTADDLLGDLWAVAEDAGTPGEARLPICVISFENLTGDPAYDYLQRAIPHLLITSLEQSEHLSVATWERMRDLLVQIGKRDVATIDEETGFEICRLEGVHAVVVGSFIKAGKVFATDVKVLEVESKKMIASASSKGEGVDSILLTQIDELTEAILEALELMEPSDDAGRHPIAEVATASMAAYEHFLKGLDAYEKLYNSDARLHLEQAIEIDPTFAAAYLYLGWTLTRLREGKAQDEALNKAMELRDHASPRQRLYIEAAHARTIEQESEKEFQVLKRLASEYPAEKRVHHRLAGYYRAQGLLYQAIEEYNKVLELDPDYGWAMNELGYMYADVEDYDKAHDYFARYAESSPGDANPVDSMGELYFRMGRYDEAIEQYREALRLRPDFYYAYWEIAYVSALKEEYAEAQGWIDAFVEKAPSFGTKSDGVRWRAFYHYWTGDFDQALRDAQELATISDEEKNAGRRAEADRMRGWIYLGSHELALARKHFESCLQAIDRAPRDFLPSASSYSAGSLAQVPGIKASYRFGLGMIDIAEGDLDAARSRRSEIEPQLPRYAEILRAETLIAAGSFDKAITVCGRTEPWRVPYLSDTESMLAYNLPPLTDALARAYHGKGELYRAISEYERMAGNGSGRKERRLVHPLIHFRLAKLYEEKDWGEKARAQYERFLEICGDSDGKCREVAEAMERLKSLG